MNRYQFYKNLIVKILRMLFNFIHFLLSYNTVFLNLKESKYTVKLLV